MARKKSGIDWKKNAFPDIRNTPESRKLVNGLARDVAAAASRNGEVEGYKVTDLVLEDPRSAASVIATGHARMSNRKHHSLVKALDQIARGG